MVKKQGRGGSKFDVDGLSYFRRNNKKRNKRKRAEDEDENVSDVKRCIYCVYWQTNKADISQGRCLKSGLLAPPMYVCNSFDGHEKIKEQGS